MLHNCGMEYQHDIPDLIYSNVYWIRDIFAEIIGHDKSRTTRKWLFKRLALANQTIGYISNTPANELFVRAFLDGDIDITCLQYLVRHQFIDVPEFCMTKLRRTKHLRGLPVDAFELARILQDTIISGFQ